MDTISAIIVGIFLQQQGEEDLRTRLPEIQRQRAEVWLRAGIIEESDVERLFPLNWKYSQPMYYSAIEILNDFNDGEVTIANELAEMEFDCPPISDKEFLPPQEVCYAHWMLANNYIGYLVKLRPWLVGEEVWVWDRIVEETKWRSKCWYSMYRASFHSPYISRRLLLQEVRKLVGRENYNKQQWPDPLPWSGFYQLWDWNTRW